MSYSFKDIEKKWQTRWAEAKCFQASIDTTKRKYYALDMFPYPSGAGLHVGHLASYTPTDIIARFKRAQGFNVLHPFGYDAFGLPAEQYAIQTGVHPEVTTRQAIDNFRNSLVSYGFSFDWSREVSTCDPQFYRWTQYIFLKLFEHGLVYQKEVPVNWCPALRTVLANEEVINGKSERGGHDVVRMPMKQWMLKITAYAERLLTDLDELDWPERTKEGQRNWIGRSQGAEIQFELIHNAAPGTFQPDAFKVFTTRPDTIFGVTALVLAPEHDAVSKITARECQAAVAKYVESASKKSEVDRKASATKTGFFLGAYVKHPFSQRALPIWIADYVLPDYGTGAVMLVPAHDERDYEFAQNHQLPVINVIQNATALPYSGTGTICESDFLNGLSTTDAARICIERLETLGIGRGQVQYKLRDWLFSRQRYWGEPFPLVEFADGTLGTVAPEELPVELPPVPDYQPSATGEPPLARNLEFINYQSASGQQGQRVADTMPGSAGSSWYFLRYTDPHNSKLPFGFAEQAYWMPVDLYVGGTEHTVGHLLYARFWQKFLYDIGLTSHKEPFLKLAHQGVIMGSDGQRMSKSRGNVVNTEDIRDQYGADCVRLYVSFLGPFAKDKPWSDQGIQGVKRFLERCHRLVWQDDLGLRPLATELSSDLNRLRHITIKKVTQDLTAMNFNTAISALMVWVNELTTESNQSAKATAEVLKELAQMLQPLAPHIAEEMWQHLGGAGFVAHAQWPEYDEDLAREDEIEMGVQINGKVKATITLKPESSEAEAIALAKLKTNVAKVLNESEVVKVIYKPGRILNFIVKSKNHT